MTIFPRMSGIEALCQTPPGHNGPYVDYTDAALSPVRAFHRSIPGYTPTPLHRLRGLANRLGLKEVYVKDESFRFGLNAYKVMGGLYAVARVICRELGLDIAQTRFEDLMRPEHLKHIRKMTFVTATDGNHGCGVAWAAARFGSSSYIYMPRGASQHRVDNISRAGATSVEVVDMVYDDAVRHAGHMAEEQGWHLVQDTAWEGYTEIPTYICQGYTTMLAEVFEELKATDAPLPTHVFLQAGVGSLAGAAAAYLHNRFGDSCPTIAVVEPDTIACLYHSALQGDGQPHALTDESHTLMAGLNCGEPSLTTWPILRDIPSHYIRCADFVAARGMRFLSSPIGDDPRVVSGESGAVGAGLITLLMERENLAELCGSLGLDANSVVLTISTEGDTDPQMYDKIVRDGFCPTED